MTSNEQTKTTLPRRLANRLLRRYNAAFTGAIALGGVLAPYAHHLKDAVMFPVGVSLIISGAVGLAMSFMTGKVAEELKNTIREGDAKTHEKLELMDSKLESMDSRLESIDSTLKELVEILKNK